MFSSVINRDTLEETLPLCWTWPFLQMTSGTPTSILQLKRKKLPIWWGWLSTKMKNIWVLHNTVQLTLFSITSLGVALTLNFVSCETKNVLIVWATFSWYSVPYSQKHPDVILSSLVLSVCAYFPLPLVSDYSLSTYYVLETWPDIGEKE